MKYLGFAPLAYCLDIMRPLQEEARRRGDDFIWWTPNALRQQLTGDEASILSDDEVSAYQPDAVFSPVDWVPYWFPGRKVWVFHGFDTNKRNDDEHYRIRGWYDLILPFGPSTTPVFQKKAEQYGFFQVTETGWPKLDALFGPEPKPLPCPEDKPVVIYASTFGSKNCSIPILADEIERLIKRNDWHWLLTTHPKTDDTSRQRLVDMANKYDNAQFVTSESTMAMMKAGDVMVCDTSSIVLEFMLQQRPAVTYRYMLPGPHLIDTQQPGELESAINKALSRPPDLMRAITEYGDHIHPYRDGCSAARCLDATEQHIHHFRADRQKPANLLRKWKLRKRIRRLAN